jgi:hypothetical protein
MVGEGTMTKTYKGSCHCGAARFSCPLDLAPAGERSTPERPRVWWTSSIRCNSSYCWKTRLWKAFVPAAAFQIEAGGDVLRDYQFGARQIHHLFCGQCGTTVFARAHLEQMGGDFYAVNLACLDGVSPETLARIPITHEDGRQDAWDRPPPVTGYL